MPLFPNHFPPTLSLHVIVDMSLVPLKETIMFSIPPNPWGSACTAQSRFVMNDGLYYRFLSILVIQSELSTLLIASLSSLRLVMGSCPCHVTFQYPNISMWLIPLSRLLLSFYRVYRTFSSRSFVSLSISSPALWRQKQSETTAWISTTFHSDSESTSNIQHEN